MGVDRVGQCIREVDVLMLALLFLFPCFLLPWREREQEREKGNFSIAEAVRQRTAERENKSAPVWSLVATRSKGLVQKGRERRKGGRECQPGPELQRNNVLLLYFPLNPAPVCRLNLPSLI